MLSIHRLLGSNRNQVSINQRSKSQPKCEERLIPDKNDGLDTVSFSSKKSEKFADVRAELAKNVPDRTTTIEEKQKALSYIERMLKCSDITSEMKNYWANKRDTIQMEIQMIKNEQQAGKDSSSKKVVQEYRNFIQQRWCDNYPKERNSSLDFLDSEEYSLTFYNTCFSYLNRILACKDLTDSERSQFTQEINHWNAEKQSRLGEINWHKQNNKIKTESYKNVLTEMGNNVPDSTTTIEEKKLALAYIKRMLLCDDVPNDVKNFWTNKKNIIEMEIQGIKNLEELDKNQNYADIVKEFEDFNQKYWEENIPKDAENTIGMEPSDLLEYLSTARRVMLTYCERILACSNLPENERESWQNIKMYFISDVNYSATELNEYNKTKNRRTESYNGVLDELRNNVPDRTSTIAEKQLAISYIKRMLSCDDISNDVKSFWENKKNIIEMEIQGIKNLQETNGHQKFEDVQKEFNEFSQKYWVENVLNGKAGLNNLAFDDAQEYYFTVRRIMITYCDKILACSDLPREEKQYYENIKNSFKCDLNSYAASSNQHNKTENKKTESFYDVIEEMRANVPDSTRTINEKRLAISYIERMLSCDNIPNPEYWQNKLNTIEKELQALENHGARRR